MAVDRRILVDPHRVSSAAPDQCHMEITWSDQGMSRQHTVSVLRFLDSDPTEPVQPVGPCSRKSLRHMLRNQNWWSMRLEPFQYFLHSLRSTGRRTNGDDGISRLNHGAFGGKR